MEKNRNAKSQHLLWIVIFCLMAIGLITAGIFYYRYEAQLIKDDKYEDISVIANLKAESIQDWRKQKLADVHRVAVGPLASREIARLLHDPVNTSARAALHIQLNINRKNNVYADAFFLDTKGKILLSDNPNPLPVDKATMKAIEIALKERKEALSDFFRDSENVIYIDAVAPIPDNSGQPIAIVALRSKAEDFLYPLIQTWPTPSKTAETLLVRRDGDSVLFLNELRHKSNTALNLRVPITSKTLPAVQTVSGKYNRLYGKDYRGVDVLAIGRPILQSPWFIVSKVDEKEILTEVRYRAWVIFIIVALLLVIAEVIISLIYRNQREVEGKKAEDELRESETRLSTIFKNDPTGIFMVNEKTRIIYDVNDSALEAIGLPKGDVVGKVCHRFLCPAEMGSCPICDLGQTVDRSERMLLKPDGTRVPILKTVVPIKLKGENYLLESFIDITERKRLDDALKNSEAKYRGIFENATEGIYQSTTDGRFITANAALVRMAGYNSPEELIESIKDIETQLYVNPEDRKRFMEIRDAKGFVDDFEVEFYKKDGSKFWVVINARAVKDEQGKLLYTEGLIEDITLRKHAEEQLNQTLDSLKKAIGVTIHAMVSAVEMRDPYTSGHQSRSADLACAIATEMGLAQEKIEGLRMAGSIHDIGKISIPAEILSKPTKLTNIEFSLIKEHSRIGYEVLKDVESPWPLAQIVYQHHERMNGSGYPGNLKGDEIIIEARIMAVADVVEAMASHRPYRPSLSIKAALEEIEKNKGILYDNTVADTCLKLFREKGYQLT